MIVKQNIRFYQEEFFFLRKYKKTREVFFKHEHQHIEKNDASTKSLQQESQAAVGTRNFFVCK